MMTGVMVRKGLSILWAMAACAIPSLMLVGFGSALYAWYASDPGCECFAQKLYVSRVYWETHKTWIEIITLVVFLGSAILLRRVLLQPAVIWSLLIGLAAGAVTWAWFAKNVEPSLTYALYLQIPASKVIAVQYYLISSNLIDPMLSWRFLASFAACCLSAVCSWLIFKLRARAASGPPAPQLQTD
jgi:hypothetical protein